MLSDSEYCITADWLWQERTERIPEQELERINYVLLLPTRATRGTPAFTLALGVLVA